tara:strand:+ start:656 stop:1807 length:1152 start_codon:yes stop_codon:yes gene_type:complete
MKRIILLSFLITSVVNAQFRPFVINECMPNNTNTAADQDGEYNDWVEFYNTTNSSVNIGGYFLSDRKSEPTKFQFPNLVVNSNEYLIVWLDKDTLQEGLHTNFKLSASSEQVYLFNPDTNLVDYVHFTNVQADISIARNFDGNGSFSQSTATYMQTNGVKENGIVLNEWMANNTNVQQDEHGEYNDWIELYNNSNQAKNLNGYFLSNKANEATKYKFPNILLAAHEYLIVWADEDTLQGSLHLPFKLDSERDDIILSRPDTSTVDYFFHHNVDSNITMARIPNGIGNISLGNSTFETSNLAYVSLYEEKTIKLNLFPNPTSNFISIQNINRSTAYIDLLDVNGKLLNRYYTNNNILTIDLSKLKPSTYFVRTGENEVHKIAKQ